MEPPYEATSDGKNWVDMAASGFESGTGSSSNPYIIATAEQLARIAGATRANAFNFRG